MKRNLLQILTLILCAALLVTVVIQGRKLDDYQTEMENRLRDMERDQDYQIQDVYNEIDRRIEQARRLVDEYTLEPAGIDAENRVLQADVKVNLKQWYEDTQVTLLMAQSGENLELPMENGGNGVFAARVSFPVEDHPEVKLDALISGGGLTTQESLDYVGDFTMLLPLQADGGGWSGPEYRDGVLRCSFFNFDLRGRNDEIVTVHNPEFHIYRNGKLAQVVPAVTPLYGMEVGSYRPNNVDESWELECEYGDTVEVFFRCVDEFGLGYEFPFQAWTVDTETDSSHVSGVSFQGDGNVTLFWPE